jgi:hypothetical protein
MEPNETRIARLEKQVQDLQRHVASRPPPAEFTQYRGALFKRRAGNEYEMAVYCPLCLLPAGCVSGRHFRCHRCAIELDIGGQDLSDVIYNHVQYVKG